MGIHIGSKIEEVAKLHGLGPTELSKKLNTTRENIYNIFAREIVDAPLLLLCCKVLNHDFFKYFYEEDPLNSFRLAETQMWQAKLDVVKEDRDQLKYLIDVQKELIETQRDDLHHIKTLLAERDKEILELNKSIKK